MATVTSPLRFKATLQRPATPKGAAWCFLVLPSAVSARLPSRSQVSVEGTLAGHPFKATLEPDGQGGHWLKVGKALRAASGISAGQDIEVQLAPVAVEPEPRMPAALRQALAADPAAKATWLDITAKARRDWIQWITTAKQAQTRARRVENACSMLASGKRRACCFDRSGMYGKSLSAPEAAKE